MIQYLRPDGFLKEKDTFWFWMCFLAMSTESLDYIVPSDTDEESTRDIHYFVDGFSKRGILEEEESASPCSSFQINSGFVSRVSEITLFPPSGRYQQNSTTGEPDTLTIYEPKPKAVWYKTRSFSLFVYFMVSILSLASSITLVVIVVIVAVPFTRVSNFEMTSCTAAATPVVEDEYMKCSCGRGCHSDYPCLKIRVRHEARNQTTCHLSECESTLSKEVNMVIKTDIGLANSYMIKLKILLKTLVTGIVLSL